MAQLITTDLGGIPTFDCDGEPTTVGVRWQKWRRAFELFVVGKGIENAAQKRALLLHCGGMKMQDIYFTFPAAREPDGDETVYDIAMEQLDNYFRPRVNTPFERHGFRLMTQEPTESVDQFVTRLKQKAQHCNFDNADEHIRDQVIEKCKSSHLRRKLLERGGDLTLEQTLTTARAFEQSQQQATGIEGGRNSEAFVNKVSVRKHKPNSSITCYRCGQRGHIKSDPACPAIGQICLKCNKPDHFAKCCKSFTPKTHNYSHKHSGRSKPKPRVRLVDTTDQEDSDEAYAFTLSMDNPQETLETLTVNGPYHPTVTTNIGGVEDIVMIVDSGASCNVLDHSLWEELKKKRVRCTSQRSSKKLYPYGSSKPLDTLGSFMADISVGNSSVKAEFIVIQGKGQALLGHKTATELGILKVAHANFLSEASIFTKYEKYFNGVGKLKNFKLMLHIDENVTPVAQQVRRIPFAMREKVEAKLKELQDMDIIEPVEGPSSWVSPIVVTPKQSGDIRLCVDMRQANEAIIRERHPIPTIDEILHELNGSCIFSKLDLKWGFHQLELADESRDITTFVTHIGLFRYKRLSFGVTSAPEIYQHTIQQALHGCDGVRNMSDDIIVHAKTMEEHDRRLLAVIEKLGSKGLTFNKEKCQLRLRKLEFMGHVLSDKGIDPTREKVKAIVEARPPTNASEVRSFLGLVTYCGKFIPNLASLSEPLRLLTRKNQPFTWGPEQDKAFRKLKTSLSKAETLGYFDPKARTQVIADASPVGLGAVLVQIQQGEPRIICFASKSLTDVERRYSQTEKEALALVWACERFYMYLYGIEFDLLTDHKPLQFIYSKKSNPCARIQRWVLRLQPFQFTVKYIPGHKNVADVLSRLCIYKSDAPSPSEISEDFVRFVALQAVPRTLTIQEVEKESAGDLELHRVKEALLTGNWTDCEESYVSVKTELCSIGKVILRGTRIVIPTSLRERVLSAAHEGHQGITKTKQRLREKVWWPKIDSDAERVCKKCYACQVVGGPSSPEPLRRKVLPDYPWQATAIDLMGPFPTGESVLVYVDYYSRFFETFILKNTGSTKIIECLEEIFARYGIPDTLRSDNGAQFRSAEFEKFLEEYGINHETSTPYWPQANGEVERQNKTLLKAIRTAHVEGKDWRKELPKFLSAYRNTPHTVTGVAPNKLIFRYPVKTKIPSFPERDEEDIRVKDWIKKKKEKEYADKSRNAKYSQVQVGDQVLVQQPKENKLSPAFETKPYEVVGRTGNEVLLKAPHGGTYRRNVKQVKNLEIDGSVPLDDADDVTDLDLPQSKLPDDGDDLKITDMDDDQKIETDRGDSVRTRPVRQHKLPDRFKDFVLT